MFQDLDATLRAVLSDATAPAALRAADISFDTPDKDYKPPQLTLNMFLYELAENRGLRDEARVVHRTNDIYTSRLPSLRVDCAYLVTAWSSKAAGLKAKEEHGLLGVALTWLSRFPVIDDHFLQGALGHPVQPYPVPTTVAQTREGQAMGHFWSALGVPPRPAFSITVTITIDPFDEVETFVPVQAVRLEGTLLDDPALSGRVLDHELTPVAGAAVAVVDPNDQVISRATSDHRGAFAVRDLSFGAYTLRVAAAGTQIERDVTYERNRQIHNVLLPQP